MEKLTLEESWKYCLKMWKWIKEESKKVELHEGEYLFLKIEELKREWLKLNKMDEIYNNCFFCKYGYDNKQTKYSCNSCPGVLIDKDFRCNDDKYAYDKNPELFYKELLRLNKIRKAQK